MGRCWGKGRLLGPQEDAAAPGGWELCRLLGMAGESPLPPLQRCGIAALQDLMRFSWQPAFLPAPQPLRVIAALSRSGGVKTRDYTVSVVPF